MVYTSKRLNSVEETRLPTFKVFKYPNKCGHKTFVRIKLYDVKAIKDDL